MKVYALYEGSIHEGGGVKEIYADLEKATKFALLLVHEKKTHAEELHGDSTTSLRHLKDWKEIKYEWLEKSSVKRIWQNSLDEVSIHEYDVIE